MHPSQSAEDLFEQHGAAVYRFATVLLHHHQDAEDVVQETFLKLFHHLTVGGSMANLRGWLFTVAANAARDRQRRRARWIPWAQVHDRGVPPPQLPDEDGQRRAAREALHRLPERDRLLLALRAQALSYRDIAAAAREKVLRAHTGTRRAAQLETYYREAATSRPLPKKINAVAYL